MGVQACDNSTDKQTYYEILQISPDASTLDIKEAYRRLALQHHPDRNGGNTERFQEIGEAYSCLSDPVKKYGYDQSLQLNEQKLQTSTSSSTSSAKRRHESSHGNSRFMVNPRVVSPIHHTTTGRRRYPKLDDFDAFAQFDRNFGHDPFFQEAFREMDDEFSRRFLQKAKESESKNPQQSASATNRINEELPCWSFATKTSTNNVQSKEGWIPWLLRQCGIEVQMSSFVSNNSRGDGNYTTTSSYYSSSKESSSYRQQQSQVYLDAKGRQVRVQSIEQNGNQIEDTYVNNRLVQRKINGNVEPVKAVPRNALRQ